MSPRPDDARDPGPHRDRVPGPAPDAEVEPDDLAGFETPLVRVLRRTRGWLAAVVAIGLLLPAGGWLVSEFAFGAARDEVAEELGGDAALADALLLVRSADCVGRVSTGSAFVLETAAGPVVVTNRHVVEEARSTALRPLRGGPALTVTGHRLAEVADVAVLEVAEADALPAALRAGDQADIGEEVRTVGFPGGRPATTVGLVTEATAGRLLLDLAIDPGASGSPVVDEDGRVVGQVHARTTDGRGVATPLGRLLRAIEGAAPAPDC